MKGILVICLQTALIVMISSVAKRNFNATTEKYSWDRALRAHNTPEERYDKDAQLAEDDQPGQYCLCSKIYDPICASNNESYFNLCYLECKVSKEENISVIHQGNCIPF